MNSTLAPVSVIVTPASRGQERTVYCSFHGTVYVGREESAQAEAAKHREAHPSSASDVLAGLSDEESAVADALRDAVCSARNVEGLSRSAACRRAKVEYTTDASRLLALMAQVGIVVEAGNGAWTRYHAPAGR